MKIGVVTFPGSLDDVDAQRAVRLGGSEAVAFVPFGTSGAFIPGQFRNDLSDWWGSLRLRAGVAFDRVLVYATGGLAYTEDNTGWVVGGDVEWALPVGGLFGSIGSVATFGLVWDFADVMNGLMAVPNLISLLALSGVVVRETRRFFEVGREPVVPGSGQPVTTGASGD